MRSQICAIIIARLLIRKLASGTPYRKSIYFLNIFTNVGSFTPELGGVEKFDYFPSGPNRFQWLTKSSKSKLLTVYKKRITGRVLWKYKRFGGVHNFVSDVLIKELSKTSSHGWRASEYFQEL